MALAQANVAKVKYLAEVTPGVTPAAAMTLLNNTGFDLTGNITTTTSTTIRSDRGTSDLVRTKGASTGTINFETRFGEYDTLIAAALGGTWSTPVALTAATISAAAADNSFNDSGAGFSTANILPGMWVKIKGFATAANNGIFKAVSVTTSKIVVSGGTLVNESAGPSVTLNSKSVRNGIVKPTFSIEQEFTDIVQFCVTKGALVNTMQLAASTGAILNGNFGFMGRDTSWAGTTFGTGADVAVGTNNVMSAAANVGSVFENGTALATSGVYVKSLTFDTTNNSRDIDAISNLYPVDINHGSFGATLQLSTFFANRTLLDKFLAGTATDMSFSFRDDAGNYIVVDLPYVKLSAGKTNGIALNSDVMVDVTATALVSPTLGYMAQVSSLVL